MLPAQVPLIEVAGLERRLPFSRNERHRSAHK